MVMLQELDSNQISGNVSVNNDRSSDGRGDSAVSNKTQNPESLVQIETAYKNEEIHLPRNFPYPPLDLNFPNPPSSLDVAIIKQSLDQNAISSACRQKLKASNFPFSILKIGLWMRVTRNEGDLVVKVYFAKKRLVWEILENCLKRKIEIQWDQIVGMKALIEANKPAILEIELSEPPIFAHETHPQPRNHTIWHPTQDFTNNQASVFRIHSLEIPSGAINKDFEKLLRVYPRFIQLIQGPFPSLSSPYFTSILVQGNCSRMPTGFRTQPSIQWNNQETGCKMNPDCIDPTNMPQNFSPPTNMPQNFSPPTNLPQNFRPPINMPQNFRPPANMPQNFRSPTNLPQNYRPPTSIPQNYRPPTSIPQNYRPPTSIPQNFRPPASMCFGRQDNKGQTNGCEMAPELMHPAHSHFGIEGNWQHMDPECRAHNQMCFYMQDNGEGNGFEMDPELEHPANMHFSIQGNSLITLEYKPPINNDFGIEDKQQHNFCDMSLKYKAPINMDFQQEKRPGLGIATNSVASTYVPIHGNRYEVESFQPAAYPSIPAIDSVPPGQTYEQINRPFLYIDSSQRSDESISNHIVDSTSMSGSVQGMKRLQNHHQNYNLPITPNEALESLNAHMVSNIEKHLMDDAEAQYIDTQNLQANSENTMHSMIDLHNKMNLAVASVGNTPLYEIQTIPNENWVSNTTYYDGVGQQLQPQSIAQTFSGSPRIQQTNNS